MDESLIELENELKRLRPRALAPRVYSAMDRELRAADTKAPGSRYAAATTFRSWKWLAWSLAGATAVVAIIGYRWWTSPGSAVPSAAASSVARQETEPARRSDDQPAQVDRYEPVQATSVLYGLQEGEPTTLPDRTVGREVRYRFVDTYTWRNPATNASVRWNVPREEVRLVRANLD